MGTHGPRYTESATNKAIVDYLVQHVASPPSAAYTALTQEGYNLDVGGGANFGDSPESGPRILGKAASLCIHWFCVTNPPPATHPIIDQKMFPVLAAIFFAVSDERDPNTVRAGFAKLCHSKGSLEEMQNATGFLADSAFAKYLTHLESLMKGGGNAEQRKHFALCMLCIYAARDSVGERQYFPEFEMYTKAFNYLNQYWAGFGPDAPLGDWTICNLTTEGFSYLESRDYSEIFREIETSNPSNQTSNPTMWGFEDVTEIFQSPPDMQLEKDAELQVYRIGGAIDYDHWWWYDTPLCEDNQLPMKNLQGKVTGYQNIGPTSFPCVDESKNVVPITGTAFERAFVEAPPVSGTYDAVNTQYIIDETRNWYPNVAYFGDDFFLENYRDEDCKHVTTYASQGYDNTHYLTDASNYEAYYFINNHEGGAGNPWGYSLTCALTPSWPPGGECKNTTNQWIPIYGDCTGAGWEWVQPLCIHPAPPNPNAFPGQQNYNLGGTEFGPVRDMSLRHSLRIEDYDTSIPYWEDIGNWEFTGFTMVPLMYHIDRMNGLYKDHLTNPIVSVDKGNLQRRAFSYGSESTASVLAGTVGPPQAFQDPTFGAAGEYNYMGGPMIYAQVYVENKTKLQGAKINLFPGWPYRYRQDPYGTFDLHHTGGWNFPLIEEASAGGFEDALTIGAPEVIFAGNKISNNFNEDGNRSYKYNGETESFYMGTGINPSTNERWSGVWEGGEGTEWEAYDPDPPDPFHYNQELIVPQKFFGMGDGCANTPVKTIWSQNAGTTYSFHEVDITGITHPYLRTVTGAIDKFNRENEGAEGFFKGGILGQHGDNFWDEFVTGWINTGHAEHPYAGESVHCLHQRTGISTEPGSIKAALFYYLGRGIGDIHFDFPYQGVDCLINHGQLAPYPNISKCCDLFTPPHQGPTGCLPTTTTTADPSATTTTCDPYEPCTTTTTEGPMMQDCDGGYKATCPDGSTPGGYYDPDRGMCNWVQCTDIMGAECEIYPEGSMGNPELVAWDSGIFPHERGWAEMKTKQRNENPPRYWRGPYASTHFTFLYKNAQSVLEDHYPPHVTEEYGITGFPEKVFFKVNVQEWIVKDFISGGYIGEDGEVVWLEKNADFNFPSESGDYEWSNLVDESYVPKIMSSSENPYWTVLETNQTKKHDLVLNYARADGRNIEVYKDTMDFDRGNQRASGTLYGYGTTADDATFSNIHYSVGGFSRYTGYSFDMELTYAKPTYTLNTLVKDTSSMVNALSVGNQLYYKCGGNGTEEYSEDYYDPIYFMPMESNLRTTGIFNRGGLNDNNQPFTGTLLHQKEIYGDRWIGLRAASVFSRFVYEIESGFCGAATTSPVAGSLGDLWMAHTGKDGRKEVPYNSEYDEQCMIDLFDEFEMGGMPDEYWCESISNCYGTSTGFCGPPVISVPAFTETYDLRLGKDPEPGMGSVRAHDNRVWLFNLGASGLDVHVRAPDFISGYQVNLAPSTYMDEGSEFGEMSKDDVTASIGFEITGTHLAAKEPGVDLPAAGNKSISFFTPEWLSDREINYTAIIYEKEGLLFEKPTQTWELAADDNGSITGYETIYAHGARLKMSDPTNEVKVSGWKETSKVKITLSDFSLGSYGAFPNDSYWTMEESGNAMVTGALQRWWQAEAAIYSEGIVMEDKSDDPLRDVLNYPHYASDTMWRPGVIIPTGAQPDPEALYNPDFDEAVSKYIRSAPSRMLVRKIEHFPLGTGMDNYFELMKGSPYYYNRYIWPTMSDMADWNGSDLSYETQPAPDAYTYPLDNLMISASAGQPDTHGKKVPFVQRHYAVTEHIAFYDGVVLDPTINKEWWVNLDTKFSYDPKTSYFTAQGVSTYDVIKGQRAVVKHTLHEDGSDTTSEGGEGAVVGILT